MGNSELKQNPESHSLILYSPFVRFSLPFAATDTTFLLRSTASTYFLNYRCLSLNLNVVQTSVLASRLDQLLRGFLAGLCHGLQRSCSRTANYAARGAGQEGWLKGGIAELAILLHRSSIPAWWVVALGDALELGVNRAATMFSATHPIGSSLGLSVAQLLGQHDDAAGQTRRMAMTVLVDALVFHVASAEAELEISDPEADLRMVMPPTAFREHGSFRPTALANEWQKILGINYWPIFHTASSIVRCLPTQTAAAILNVLWETTENLVIGR